MGVDYRLKIYRKKDDALLEVMCSNQLKPVLDSEFAELINCENGRDCDGVRFEYRDLVRVVSAVDSKIKEKITEKIEKKLMILGSKNAEMKREFELDIRDIEESIDGYRVVFEFANELKGMISCLVEDRLENGVPAYEYNGTGLPKEVREYANGEKYESPVFVWVEDVYFKIEADW